MQQRSRRDRVRSPMTERRVQIIQTGFIEERYYKQERRRNDQYRSEQVQRSPPRFDSIFEISADPEIKQTS
jgi:hypothetical protein